MTSAVLERQCVIHVVDCSETIKILGENQLKKCQDAQLVYKFRENSNYSKITVPTSIDNYQRYHPTCYKIFRSVSIKEVLSGLQRQNFLDQAANQNSSRPGCFWLFKCCFLTI
jgi:hypothetical protein